MSIRLVMNEKIDIGDPPIVEYMRDKINWYILSLQLQSTTKTKTKQQIWYQ